MPTASVLFGAALSGAGVSAASLGASDAASARSRSQGKPANAKDAATQFEGLLIEEMLRSAHESNPGSLGGDDEADAQNDTISDMATQQFAQVMARQGGFGIAKVVDAGIARQQASIDSKQAAALNAALPR
jgi:Rod binding domain-containing protein